jgi:uncharacterized protein involved in type VI secretion and phage assembly
MTPMDSLLRGSDASEHASRTAGVTTAIVTDVDDKKGLGRVLVKFPWTGKNSAWAPVVTPMAGNDRGLYCLPEVNDHVLVMFDRGNIDSPFVIGAVWNGKDKPPLPEGKKNKNDVRVLKSRSGHTVTLDDESGKEQIVIVDKTGKNKIVIDSATNQISIHSSGDLAIESDKEITITAKAGLNLKGAPVKINDGTLEVA